MSPSQVFAVGAWSAMSMLTVCLVLLEKSASAESDTLETVSDATILGTQNRTLKVWNTWVIRLVILCQIPGPECQDHAECSPYGGCMYNEGFRRYQCQCRPPYSGDGYRCFLEAGSVDLFVCCSYVVLQKHATKRTIAISMPIVYSLKQKTWVEGTSVGVNLDFKETV